MSQSINLTGQLVLTNGSLRNIITLTNTLLTTGSNSITNTINVATGSWVVVDQGSNADFRFGYFSNTDYTSSVKVAIGSTGSYASLLQPQDDCILTNSGSTTIYITAVGANSPVVVQYLLTEK